MFYHSTEKALRMDLSEAASALWVNPTAIIQVTPREHPETDLAILTAQNLSWIQEVHYVVRTIRDHYTRLKLTYPALASGRQTNALSKEALIGLASYAQQIGVLLDVLSSTEPLDPAWEDAAQPVCRFLDHLPVRNAYTDALYPFLSHLFTPQEALRSCGKLPAFYQFCKNEASKPEPKALRVSGNTREQEALIRCWVFALSALGERLIAAATFETGRKYRLPWLKNAYTDLLHLYERTVADLTESIPFGWPKRKEDAEWRPLASPLFGAH